MITIHQAIDAFARGFTFTRSFTHPYLPEQIGKVWVLRDAPRTRKSAYRREEWICNGVPAKEVDAMIRKHTRGRYAVCAIRTDDEPEAAFRAEFKAAGYRLGLTEALMVHPLEKIPKFAPPDGIVIEQVLTQERADALAKTKGKTKMLPEHLCRDAALRQYIAIEGNNIVGWVRNVDAGEATWCASMEVLPEYRRRGIARALLSTMLRDCKKTGAVADVLLASHAGAMLYPVVGYHQIGTLYLFTPSKR